MDIDKELRKLPAEGYIWLSMRAVNTKENSQFFQEFKDYAKRTCDDNYVQTLKELMSAVKEDYKYASLYDEIQDLKMRLLELERKVQEPKKEEPKKQEQEEEGTF